MKKHFIKLANNPRVIARKMPKIKKERPKIYRYLFDFDTHELLIKFENRKASYDFFADTKTYTIDQHVYKFEFFTWNQKKVILSVTQTPNYSKYKEYKPKPVQCFSAEQNWNNFIEQRKHLDSVDRGIPFFHSVGGVSSRWKKPQYVLSEEEAIDNGLEPCFQNSNFFISNKHVIYIKQNDLYYKMDMTF